MLRAFRGADADSVPGLLVENFPEEERLLGYDPSRLIALIRRAYRWDARLLLALGRLIGRPVFDAFVVEAEGKLAALALVTYGARAGFVSSVVVAPEFRRRGYAQTVVRAAERAARKARRRHVALDVLVTNDPARALYAKLGYRPLRDLGFFVKPVAGPAPDPPSTPPGLREFQNRDGVALAAVANEQLAPAVREVLPAEPGHFAIPELVVRGLGSESVAWVIDRGSGPIAFLRATQSPAVRAGHLTAPVIGSALSPKDARDLVEVGTRWLGERGVPRIVVEAPTSPDLVAATLGAAGFTLDQRITTFSHPL